MKKYLLFVVLATFLTLLGYAQPGKDGNVTIATSNTVVNTYSRITVPVTAGATNVTVNSVATDLGSLTTGDLIMLYQAQGAQVLATDDNNYGAVTSYNGAGTYEFAYVASVAGNIITLGCGTKQAFSVTGRSQIIKVPQYNNITINSGRSIIPAKWNGATGGIVVVHVAGTLTNNGTITSDAAGFRGGKRDNLTSSAGAGIITLYRSTSANDGAEKGEGIVGYQADYDAAGMGGRYGRGAPANGGGGGNGHNAAGGGGANGNNGQTWTGAGVMDPNPLYLTAWKLDPDYVSNGNALTNSSGGGRGGYTYGSVNVDAFTIPLSNAAWGGDYRDPVGGRGGRPLATLVESRIFLGGGGGAGDGNNNASADGGDGGGITYVIASTMAGTGSVVATGQNGWNTIPGHNDAPGGGGGGGTIIIKAFSFTGQSLNANGGSGGNQLIGGNESEGCGGGGGGGMIAVPTGGVGTCGVSNSYSYIYGTNGNSSSAAVTEFPPNGGTWGAPGQNDVPVSPYFQPYTITCMIDGDADGVNDPTSDLDDDNDGIRDLDESYSGVDPLGDADNDYAPNYADPSFVPYLDANCDGINDYFDFDLDGIPDFIDLDSDNDGITDCLEAGGNDANKDGIVDGFVDANGNGISDALGTGLVPGDLDGDSRPSFRDRDSDGDGITDCIEAGGTDANGDGIVDGFADTDKDGYANSVDPTTNRLALTGGNASGSTPLTIPDTDSDTKRNFLDIDSDNDGIPDNVEAQTTAGYVTPAATDTDGDGIANPYDATPLVLVNTDGADVPDYLDADSDNDGVPDTIEGHDADFDGAPTPTLPVTGDADGDGLLDAYDLASGANSTTAGMGGSGASAPLQNTDSDASRDWRDTDDDADCILTSSTGATGENTNSNTSWADDFSQGGAPRPNYLFAANTLASSGAVRCGAGTVTLSATAIVSGTFRWYDAASSGTLLQTTASVTSSNYTTPSLSTTTTYYVSFDNGCVTPRQAVTATIISASSTPTAVSASRCGTGTVTLSAAAGASGTFRWYTALTGGTLLQTTTTATASNYTTPSIATTTTYYVEFDNGTCVSARAAVTATVTTPPTVTGTDGSTCGGPTATLSASAPSPGTFTWYDAATGGNLLYTQSSVSASTFTTPTITSTTTYYVSFDNGTCPTTSRTAVTATVTTAAATPTVTNATICTSGTATLSATSGTSGTFRWYTAATGGTLLKTDNAVTSSSYTTPTISTSTDYYVEFASGTCTSARVKVTAYVITASVTAINASRCGSGIVTVGASSPIAGTFTWYDAATGGTLLLTSAASSTSSSYTTPSLTATTTYYVALATTSPSCGPTTRVAVTATIASSLTLTVTNGAACSPGTVNLSANSGGVTGAFRWYAASSGGTPLQTTTGATSSTFTTPFISATADYYVDFDNGSCVTAPRSVVRASIVGNTELTTTDVSICPGNTATLQALSLTSGTFSWYDAASGGTLLQNATTGTTDTYTTGTLTTTTTYYVSLTTTTPACTSARYPITANVFPNISPTGTGAARCGTGTLTLTATTSQAGTIRWYTAASGGTLLQTSTNVTSSTYTTPSISTTTTYYVDISDGTCTSARTAVVATVNTGTAPAAPTAPNVGRCGAGIVNLVATSATSGNFRWWSAATGGTLLFTTTGATTSTYTTPSLTSNTTYYVEFSNGTCTSTSRTATTAQVNTPPTAPIAADQSRCGSGIILLTATSSTSGTFRWYSVSSGGAASQTTTSATSSNFTTPVLATTGTYYVEFDNGTCPSSPRTAVQAIINDVPTQPTGTDGSRCGMGSVVLSAQSTTSGTFRWYAAASGGSALATSVSTSASTFNTPSVAGTTTYYVEYDNGTCTSTRTAVLATVLTPPTAPTVTPGNRCGTGTINLSANASASGTFRWYTAATGGTLLKTDAAVTTSSFTTPSLSSSLTYYVEFDNGTCGSTRTAVTATVNTFPVISGTSAGCTGVAGNGTIAVTASIGAGTLEYSSNGTTFQASSTLTGLANGTYTVYVRETTTLCTTSQAGVVVKCNVPPNVSNKTPNTNEDTPLTGDLTDAGDNDPDGTALTVDTTPVIAPIHGSIVIQADGTYTYTPNANYFGTETITFRVCDAGTPLPAACVDRTVTITINSVNDAPVAVNDNPSTNEDTPVTFNVTGNDTDIDGTINAGSVDLDPATAGIQNTFSNTAGSWAVNSSGDVTYTPALNFNGTASITYTINDNNGATSNPATITVSVAAVNDPPVAVNDNTSTNEDTPVTFNVTTNDTDVDGTIDVTTVDLDPATAGIQPTLSTTAGSWSVANTGVVTYTPALNFNGTATVSYTVNDNSSATSNAATLTITVNPVNDAPVAVSDNTTTNEDTPVTFNVTTNDTDVDGTINVATVDLDPATAGIQTTFSNPAGSWNVANTGVVTYTPALNFNGPGTVSYTVNDNSGATSNAATLTITVTPVNDAPVAVNDNASTNEDTPVGFNVTTNDTDVDGTVNASTVDLDPATTGIQTTFSNATGSWGVVNTGVVTYTPTLNFTGSASLSYTINDNTGATSAPGTITVTVAPVNDAPVAVADNPTINEDTPTTFSVTANDTDVDGTIDVATVDLDPATAGRQTTFTNTAGNWSVDNAGNVTYTPTLNFNGSTSISYTMNDNSGATSAPGTITVTVTPVNDAPVAVADIPTTNEDTPVTFSVTANDTDVDGTINVATVDLDPATAGIQTTFTHAAGSWSVDNAGNVTYTPTLNFNGTATVSYTVNDNSGATSAPGTISVTVTPVNDAPIAVNDNVTTNEDTPATFNVTTNDTDVDGTINVATVDLDPATAGIQTTITTTAGSWSVSNTGSVTFTPVLNFNGTATTTYTVNDNSGATSNAATITVTVTPVNDAPVAANDNASTNEDTPVSLNVTTNDTDVDGTINVATVDLDLATAGVQTTFTNTAGSWSVSNTGVVAYTPTLNFNGTATVSYTVNDNTGATSNSATITITVTPVNDAPVAVNDNASTNEDTPVSFNVTTNDTDVDGTINVATVDLDPATAGIQTIFTNTAGSWSVSNTGVVAYTPTSNFNGTATVSYTVNDNNGATSNTATLTISVAAVNDAPVAVNDNPTTNEDTPVTFNVTTNDTDVDGTINAASVDLDPATAGIQNTFTSTAGTWSVNNTGDVTFTPALNFNGTASITYTVNDNSGTTSNAATIDVTVISVNDAPVAVNDTPSTNEDTPVTFNVTTNDTDVDGTINVATVDLDPTTAGIQTTFTSAAGSWSVNNTGDVTFTPVLNLNGTASITYTVNDNNGLTSNAATIAVTVNAVNDAPVAVADNPTTNEDTPTAFNVTANDTDIDGTINVATVDLDPTTAGIQTTFTSAAGTWSVDNAGNVTFTPVLNFNGTAATIYVVNDNSGATSNAATITITVTPVNDVPIAVNDNASTNEDTPVSFNVTTNDTDVDGTINVATVDLDPATAGIQTTFTNAAGSWNVSNTGLVTYTPTVNFNGTASVSYTVNDNSGATSNAATLTISVAAVNDAPVAVNDNASTNEDTPVSLNVTTNDTDVDGTINVATVDLDPATAGIQTTFSNAAGSWSVSNTGVVLYTPTLNFNGTASIGYTVNDNSGATSNTATFTVSVTAVNDAPVAVADTPTTNEDTPTTFSVTANDTDVDGTIDAATVDLDPATAGRQTTFTNATGSWGVDNAGNVSYTPTLNFNGTATISYAVNDNNGLTSAPGTISVTVTPVNDAPVAVADNPTTNEDTPATFSVTANDTDVDGTINVATVDLDPATAGRQTTFTNAAGNWGVDNAGNVTYTPTLNFNGTATVSYTVNDNSGATAAPGTISVTVTPVNDAPVAVADTPSTNEDTPATFNVTTNDTDVDGTINVATVDLDPATAGIQATFTTAAGSWSVNNTGNVTFTPVLNFNGTATTTYSVNDNTGATSNTATITVSVTPVNDAPVAVNDNTTTNEDTPVSFNVTTNDTDVDGTINVATVDLDPATAGIQTTLTNAAGSWSVSNTGLVTYTPGLNINGTASVSYTVNDNSGATSNTATLTVNVTSVNDAPVAVADNPTTNEDTPTTFSVTANDTDLDGTIDAATVDLDPATAGRQTTFTNAAGSWGVDNTGNVTYTPTLNFNGTATITYTVNDNSGATSNAATVTVNVTPVNDAPVAVDDAPATNEDTSVTFNVTTNDTDVDGTINIATVDLDPTTAGIQNTITTLAGTWSTNNTGDVTFTPALNFNGSTFITYTVNDNSGATSNIATITMTVNAVNDAPVANNDSPTTLEDTPVTFNVTTNDTDVDGTVNVATVDLDPATAGIQTTFTSAAGTWSVNNTGNVTYTPALNFNGTATITYTVNDNTGATSNAGTIAVTVTPVNDAPVAVNDNAITNEDTFVTFSVTSNDTDVDGTINVAAVDLDPATAGIQNTFTSAAGSWTVSNAGNVTYTPALNFNGPTSIVYTVNDNSGATSNTATITVNVAPVNDAPVAVNDNPSTNEDTPGTFDVVTNDTDVDGTINVATVDLDPATTGIQTTFTSPEGTWSVTNTGNVTFTPVLNFNGTASITYTVNDNNGATSNAATIVVIVIPVNDAPVANNDNPTTNEDTPATFNVTTNDTDVDGTINVATVDLDPTTAGIQNTFTSTAGTWSVGNTGSVTYTPTLNFNGTASITYTVNDNNGLTSNTATISVTVNAVNDKPVAVNDNTSTNEDTPVTFSVTTNDTDVDGSINAATVDFDQTLSGIQQTSVTTAGSWSTDASGNVTFTPVLNFNGTATLTYTVNDNNGATSNAALITITVNAVNDAPVAVNDNASTTEDTPATFNVTGNDTDVDGTIDVATIDLDPATAGIQTTFTSTAGTWSVNNTGDVTYTPALDFNGTAATTYAVKDNNGLTSNVATIVVSVGAVNDASVAVNDNPSGTEDTPATFNVTANDTDVDGTIDVTTVDLDPATAGIQKTFTSTEGTWSVDNAGNVTYTPVLNFNGIGSITYTVNDNSGATSNAATISINVTPVNDAPVAVNDNPSTHEDTSVTFPVTTNDTDVDDPIDVTTVDLDPNTPGTQDSFTSTQGTWSVDNAGDVTFTPTLNFTGTASITYTVNDNSGATSNAATIAVTVDAVNDAPVAVNDNQTTNEDTPLSFSITNNDTDIDGIVRVTTVDLDPTTAGIQDAFTSPEGEWSVSATGNVTFTPKLNFNGPASIYYTVNDNNGATSNAAVITVTVLPVNDAPVAVNDSPVTDEDTAITFDATSNDTDVDGTINDTTVDLDPATAGIQHTITKPQGTWISNVTGFVTYTPALNFNGTATLTYTVNDNNGVKSNTATITVTVNAVDDAPVAVADNPSTNEDTPVTFNITNNDTDVDGTIDPTTVDLNPSIAGIQKTITTIAGTWAVDNSGNVTFNPEPNFNGTAMLTYTVQDNSGTTSAPGTISISVQTINDTPVAVADNFTTDEDTPATFSVVTNDSDSDGTIDPATVDLDPATAGIQHVITTAAGTWTSVPTGQVTFTPMLNFNGTASIAYTVQDDEGTVSNTVSLVLTVNPVNDAPVLTNKNFPVTQGMPLIGNLLTGDTDPDGTALSVTLTPVTPPAHGTLNLTPDGNFTYTPDTGYTGADIVEIQVCDNGTPLPAACATITITFNVVDNRPPVVSSKTQQTNEDAILTGQILGSGDNDPEGAALVVNTTPAQVPAHGTIVIRPDGSYTYTPAKDYNGQDSAKIEVCDSTPVPACTTMTLHIMINAVNDGPILNTSTINALVNGTVAGNTLVGDVDPEGTVLVVSTTPVSGPLHGTILVSSDGQFQYSPAPNFIGIDTVVFEVCDQGLPQPPVCASDTLLIVVGGTSGQEVYIPEGFSPNGDGVNDAFVIGYNGNESIQLEVYNRWGNLVYKNHRYQNDWRGQAMYGIVIGTEVPDGTYFYKIRVGSFQKVKSFTIQR